jgi:hypothetical protein
VHTVRVFDHDADELLVETLMSVSTFSALTTTAQTMKERDEVESSR